MGLVLEADRVGLVLEADCFSLLAEPLLELVDRLLVGGVVEDTFTNGKAVVGVDTGVELGVEPGVGPVEDAGVFKKTSHRRLTVRERQPLSSDADKESWQVRNNDAN